MTDPAAHPMFWARGPRPAHAIVAPSTSESTTRGPMRNPAPKRLGPRYILKPQLAAKVKIPASTTESKK